MANITAPTHIDFNNWASAIQVDLSNFNIPNPPKTEEYWQGWAAAIILCNEKFFSMPMPTSHHYKNPSDWKLWAEYFCGLVYTL